VNPGARYHASGWLKTQGLSPVWLTLTANVLDASGNLLQSVLVGKSRGNSPYAYFETPPDQPIVPAPNAVFIELVAEIDGAGSGLAFLDDLRLRDRNRLVNGGFEITPPTGVFEEGRPAHWGGRGGNVFTAASQVHGGGRAFALVPEGPTHILVQLFPHTATPAYRVSAWIMTDGEPLSPTLQLFFYDERRHRIGTAMVAQILSEDSYSFVTADIGSFPAGTAGIELVLQYGPRQPDGSDPPISGRVYIDDVVVEAL